MEISALFTCVLGLAVLLWGAGCGARSFVPPLPTAADEAIRRISRIETPDAWAPFLTTIASYGVYILPRHLPQRGEP